MVSSCKVHAVVNDEEFRTSVITKVEKDADHETVMRVSYAEMNEEDTSLSWIAVAKLWIR